MTDLVAIRSALNAVIKVVDVTPYDADEALRSVRNLAALAPDHVKSIALEAEAAVLKTIDRSETKYDNLACISLMRFVTAMEHGLLRVVK